MIVQSIQTVLSYVRDDYRIKIYKTSVDPVTMKEFVTVEVYTKRGAIEKLPEKGSNLDKEI